MIPINACIMDSNYNVLITCLNIPCLRCIDVGVILSVVLTGIFQSPQLSSGKVGIVRLDRRLNNIVGFNVIKEPAGFEDGGQIKKIRTIEAMYSYAIE